MVPLMALNRLEEIWGPDASEYKWVVLLEPRIQSACIDMRIGLSAGRARPKMHRWSPVFGAVLSRSLLARVLASGSDSRS